MKFTYLLTAILGLSAGANAVPYPKNNSTQSEPFSLVAVKGSRLSGRGETAYLPVVYDEYSNIVIDSSIDSSKYGVKGVVNSDLSVSVSGNSTYLKVGDKLEFTTKRFKSAGHFKIEDGDLTYDGDDCWIICHCGKDVLVPKSLSPGFCEKTTEISLKALGSGKKGKIPDFPKK